MVSDTRDSEGSTVKHNHSLSKPYQQPSTDSVHWIVQIPLPFFD